MNRELGENISRSGPFSPHVSHEINDETMPVATHPMDIYGPSREEMQSRAETKAREAAEAQRIESVKILEKDEFKLGKLNPLIHPVELGNRQSIEAVKHTVFKKIEQYEGVNPKWMDAQFVIDPEARQADYRFIARFEVPRLSNEQLSLLEELVRQTYGPTSRGRQDSDGRDVSPESYPPAQPDDEKKSLTSGWYMGPAPYPTSPLYEGLYVFQDIGKTTGENFTLDFEERGKDVKYIVEVRDARQKQTDLVTFITQVATVLGKGELPDRGEMLYETYYDLMRLGLKNSGENAMHGMDFAMDMITRELINPLANPNISKGVGQEPQSVLLVGVPGTGKTLIVEKLLHKDLGLFILPIDPFELHQELAIPKDKQTLMSRISEVAKITGKRVILHVDDIENMAGENERTNSTLLNLMAGVQESGFHLIASTNYPRKINPSLIQPQRFSVLIHCGLQGLEARNEILKIHADKASRELNMPLFNPEQMRDELLLEVAKMTENYTPRYLANITTIAKSFLIERVAREKGKSIGLTEGDLDGHVFEIEDWENALGEVSEKYNSKKMKDLDDEMKKFVRQFADSVGFNTNFDEKRSSRRFSSQARERIMKIAAGNSPESNDDK